MVLHPPFFISSRLMPAIKVDNVTISIERSSKERFGRESVTVYFDLPDGTEVVEDDLYVLYSTPTQEVFSTLFAFLGCGRRATEETEDGGPLFAPELHDWIKCNEEVFGMLQCDLDEGPQVI
jgi:hypothetical protein